MTRTIHSYSKDADTGNFATDAYEYWFVQAAPGEGDSERWREYVSHSPDAEEIDFPGSHYIVDVRSGAVVKNTLTLSQLWFLRNNPWPHLESMKKAHAGKAVNDQD